MTWGWHDWPHCTYGCPVSCVHVNISFASVVTLSVPGRLPNRLSSQFCKCKYYHHFFLSAAGDRVVALSKAKWGEKRRCTGISVACANIWVDTYSNVGTGKTNMIMVSFRSWSF